MLQVLVLVLILILILVQVQALVLVKPVVLYMLHFGLFFGGGNVKAEPTSSSQIE